VDALQAVAEPTRREILHLVWDTERTAGDIASRFDVSFPAISQHLAVLREMRLVTVRRSGRQRYYGADRAALEDLRPALERAWSTSLERLALLAEDEERGRT
jgi:DNA-binding transcriptional ArsR family regulator